MMIILKYGIKCVVANQLAILFLGLTPGFEGEKERSARVLTVFEPFLGRRVKEPKFLLVCYL